MNSENYVLGIDGGGSKTDVVLAPIDAGKNTFGEPGIVGPGIVGQGVAGPSNLRAVGWEKAQKALDSAIASAFQSSGIERGRVAAAVIGTAGAGRESERHQILQWTKEVQLAKTAKITHDGDLALSAGAVAGIGVALISGTGSFAFGRNDKGQEARSGGWGYLLGDEGSGYALGLAALRAIVAASDGLAPATSLTASVLKQWNLNRANELVPLVYDTSFERRQIASLAPVVLRSAESGDKVASEIIGNQAAQLTNVALSVAHRLGMGNDKYCLVFAGGVLCGSTFWSGQIEKLIQCPEPRPHRVAFATRPVLGAIEIAKRLALGC